MYSGVESVDASDMVEVVFYLCADYADSRGVTQSRAGRRSRHRAPMPCSSSHTSCAWIALEVPYSGTNLIF